MTFRYITFFLLLLSLNLQADNKIFSFKLYLSGETLDIFLHQNQIQEIEKIGCLNLTPTLTGIVLDENFDDHELLIELNPLHWNPKCEERDFIEKEKLLRIWVKLKMPPHQHSEAQEKNHSLGQITTYRPITISLTHSVNGRNAPAFKSKVLCSIEKGTSAQIIEHDPRSHFVLLNFSPDTWNSICRGKEGARGDRTLWVASNKNLFKEVTLEQSKFKNIFKNSCELVSSSENLSFQFCETDELIPYKHIRRCLYELDTILDDYLSSEIYDEDYSFPNNLICGFDRIVQYSRKVGQCKKGEVTNFHGHKIKKLQCKNKKLCESSLKNLMCEKSMWRNLDLLGRARRILKLGKPHALKYEIDSRMLPCVAAKETSNLDPLTKSSLACSIETTDQGLGQIIYSTFKDYVENNGFISSISPYNLPPFSLSSKLLFDAMATDVELQLEIMAYTLNQKYLMTKRQHPRSPQSFLWKKTFENYNGSLEKEIYGENVYSCYSCMKKISSHQYYDDEIITCLEKTKDGISKAFEEYRKACPTQDKMLQAKNSYHN